MYLDRHKFNFHLIHNRYSVNDFIRLPNHKICICYLGTLVRRDIGSGVFERVFIYICCVQCFTYRPNLLAILTISLTQFQQNNRFSLLISIIFYHFALDFRFEIVMQSFWFESALEFVSHCIKILIRSHGLAWRPLIFIAWA